MAFRRSAALALSLLVTLPAVAGAQEEVEPRPGVLLIGSLKFPRPQGMSISTDARDSSRLTLTVGFDGRCKGGGLGEVWAAYVPAQKVVRLRDGRFSATVTGVARKLGGVEGRTGHFRWKVRARFLGPGVATVRVSGSAEVRLDGRPISRCKIARSATARLAVRTLRS